MADPIPRNSRAPVRPPQPARNAPPRAAARRAPDVREPAPIAAAVRPRRMHFGRLSVVAGIILALSALSQPASPAATGMQPVRPAQSYSAAATERSQAVEIESLQRSIVQNAGALNIALHGFSTPTCKQSSVSQFYAVGQRGIITTRAVMRRDNPTDQNGTAIMEGMTFTVIGASRCAVPDTYRAEMLFLYVQLDTPTGDVGWINESGPTGDGRIAYNVRAL